MSERQPILVLSSCPKRQNYTTIGDWIHVRLIFFHKSQTNTPFYPEGSARIVTSLIIPKGKGCIGNESAQSWTVGPQLEPGFGGSQ